MCQTHFKNITHVNLFGPLSGPQPFWHQGTGSVEDNFSTDGESGGRDGFWMIQAHYIYYALNFYYYYISSTSDHQALDPRGWRPLHTTQFSYYSILQMRTSRPREVHGQSRVTQIVSGGGRMELRHSSSADRKFHHQSPYYVIVSAINVLYISKFWQQYASFKERQVSFKTNSISVFRLSIFSIRKPSWIKIRE